VAPVAPNNVEMLMVTAISTAFKASDGSLYETFERAEKHEMWLTIQKALLENHNNACLAIYYLFDNGYRLVHTDNIEGN
jgi:hypothetical protein